MSIGVAHKECPPKDQPRSLLRLLEQGPESQSASVICSGGVSSVMAPPISMDSLWPPVRGEAISRPAHCPLRQIDRMWKWCAWIPKQRHTALDQAPFR